MPELNGVFLRSYDPARGRGGATERDGPRLPAEWRVLQATGPELAASASDPLPELILSENNLLPFDFLRTGDRVGRAVVKIERDDGACGTGFLVAPGILLTNHHVLPDAGTATGARAHANFEIEPPPDPAGRPASVPLHPESLFVPCAELDFAFCGVEGLDYLGCVPLRRDSLAILPSEYVSIIQHPRGRPKHVALQDSRVVRVDSVVVQYCCDTEPGSSGSPVFNNLWRLVALHHASVVTDGPGGRHAAGRDGGPRYLNEGIRLSAIALWLESAEANEPALRPQVGRIRGAFADLDGQAGYFGALGRRAGPRSAAELVIDAYGPQTGALDLAYWNLESLADTAWDNLVALGRVIAEMRVDLWCLAGLPATALRALSEHLDAHYRLDYRPIPAPAEGSGVALLVRRRPGRTVEWLSHEPGSPGHLVFREPSHGQGSLLLIPVPRSARPAAGRAIGPAWIPPPGPDDRLSPTVVLLGDGLARRDLFHLAWLGPALRAATGPDGGVVIIPGGSAARNVAFVSPNLSHTLGSPSAIDVALDRRWPATLDELNAARPIVVRLLRPIQAEAEAEQRT